MGAIVPNQGLQVIGDRASGINGPPAAILSMSVDDSATALAAGTTTLSSPTNMLAKAFDATFPSRAAQTVSHKTTYEKTEANFTVKRVVLHNIAAGSVTGTSTNVIAGIDGQSLTKTSAFKLAFTIDLAYTSG